jgi:hypothetical protein
MKEIEHMTKQMTMSDRSRAAWQHRLLWESPQAPSNDEVPEIEEVCLEPDALTAETCTTPADPVVPPMPEEAAT